MTKIKQTKEDLQRYLNEQLELLGLLFDAYDNGKTIAAKQIATVVRILVHDTEKSHSLLSQLGIKSGNFFDSCMLTKDDETIGEMRQVGSYAGIVGMGVGPNAAYLPYLDDVPIDCFGFVAFDDFWNRIVLKDKHNESFTREYLVLKVANQDGGAHVDPEIDKKYATLVRGNSMGWKVSINNSDSEDLQGVELATIRQIGHEIIKTLDPNYPKRKMVVNGAGMVVGGMGLWIGKTKDYLKYITKIKNPKVGRNDKCPCGNGLKYKKCHGK